MQWSSVAPYGPGSRATAVGVNGEGASWFFQCDGQNVLSGLRVSGLKEAEGQIRSVAIAFDKEPTEQSQWNVEQATLVLRGEPARVLSKRAALAYHAVVTVDGKPARFALSGSHKAMYELMPTCPQLEIP
ncbi:hypothetical protein [Steroidobacter sp.]|uniref:hypothetical protein n=1 Tax=Steroidobacter sp. TaxID=1978227 RepID=UPI001A645D91|nr:hypothetical protein [Steroidobacter sp.]MBL8271727.1 hypothetical protein [Steroidobacter sp.]